MCLLVLNSYLLSGMFSPSLSGTSMQESSSKTTSFCSESSFITVWFWFSRFYMTCSHGLLTSSPTSRLSSISSGSRVLLRILDSLIMNLKKNLEPTPSSDSTSISPPKSSQICLQIWRPSPMPCLLRPFFWESFPKSLNSFPLSSLLIPYPESCTKIYTYLNKNSPFTSVISLPPIWTLPPDLENFIALVRRLRETCYNL